MNEVRRDAYRQALASKGDDVDKNVISQKTILKLASTIGPGGVPLLTDKVLSLMSTDEINFLYDEYMKVMDSVNPSLETISNERFRELVDSLKKNFLSVNDLSIRELKAICSSYLDIISQRDN